MDQDLTALPARHDVDPDAGSVHVLTSGDVTRVVLAGDVDAQLTPLLRGAAEDVRSAGLPVEVDVRHVPFMDSTGLSFLARLADGGAPLPLIGAGDQVRELLEVAGLSGLVRHVPAGG